MILVNHINFYVLFFLFAIWMIVQNEPIIIKLLLFDWYDYDDYCTNINFHETTTIQIELLLMGCFWLLTYHKELFGFSLKLCCLVGKVVNDGFNSNEK